MIPKKIIITCVFVLAVFAVSILSQGHSFQEKQLEITYIGNDGFLIEYNSKKILIDALHSWPNFQSTPDEVFSDILANRPPFDDIDLILVTHAHPDHYHPDMVELVLSRHKEAVLVAPPRAVELLRISGPEVYKEAGDRRIKKMDLHLGDITELSVNGVDLKIFGLDHNGEITMLNLGFLIKIDNKTFLHEGDANINNEYFQSSDFRSEKIDILFENDYLRKGQERQKIIRDFIKPEHRIAMHIRPIVSESVFKEIEEKFPDEILFKKPLEKRIFK